MKLLTLLINVLDRQTVRLDHVFNFRTDRPIHEGRAVRLGLEYRY